MVSEVISSCKAVGKDAKHDITVKRRGGGTLLGSRPIFSLDAKYVYLNCGWGIRVFSVKTGECVQCYSTQQNDESLASIFMFDSLPSAVTSTGKFFSWEVKSGKTLLVKHLKVPSEAVVTNGFVLPRLLNPETSDICVVLNKNDTSDLFLQFFDPKTGEKIDHPLNNTVISDNNDQHNISFGGPEDDRIIAYVSSESLNISTLDGKLKSKSIKPGNGRTWTCVRANPYNYTVAAGDSTGRVVLYQNPLKKGGQKPQAVYHWHTLPCRDIAFTPGGSLMYTGGGENVLVKWTLENPQVRNYLPRLSAEITFIEISNKYEYVVVATLDNSIKIIDPQSKLVCVLQELAWGVLSVPDTPLFPAGLTFDPRTRAVVLNGRPGHLQFYSPFSETLVFSIDVTLQNYLTQERDKVIYNTDVTGACISSNGSWMATIETRDDPSARLEQRLKFWEYNFNKKCFVLNTSIEAPHNGKTDSLKFRPGSKKLSLSNNNSLDYMLISTGSDAKFRIWTPHDIDSVYRKGVVWGCENACFYREKHCGPFSFSEDGTILGVGFEDVLVLWDLVELKVSASLATPSTRKHIRGGSKIDEQLTRVRCFVSSSMRGGEVPSSFYTLLLLKKYVEFGQCEGFCEIICATEDELFVWNLMTLNLSWKISINTAILIQDTVSSHFAVFTRNNEVLIFKSKSSEPVFKKDHICARKGEVISAIFIPRLRHLSVVPSWMQDSQLFFINSNQELLCLESDSESTEAFTFMVTPEIGPNTPFSSLLATQTESTKTKPKALKQNTGYGILGSSAIAQLLKYPAHTMPPVSLLCGSFVQSLVETRKTKEELKMDIDESDDEGLVDGDSSSSDSSDDESTIGKEKQSEKSVKKIKGKHSKMSTKENDISDEQKRSEKLSLFFKDLDDDCDKFINIFDDGLNSNDKFVFDGVS